MMKDRKTLAFLLLLALGALLLQPHRHTWQVERQADGDSTADPQVAGRGVAPDASICTQCVLQRLLGGGLAPDVSGAAETASLPATR